MIISAMMKKNNSARKGKDILWFKEVKKDDVELVGGKGANLGEMVEVLGDLVPNGFMVTAAAYFKFIEFNNLSDKIRDVLKTTNVERQTELTAASKEIKQLITNGKFPDEMANKIMTAYLDLGDMFGLKQSLVAIRSSATAEDLPDASFAGQQETYLNIKGEANVINHVRKAFASLFTPRAIFYREEKGFDHFKVGLAAVVQKMIQSEVSGVMFTIDPVTNEKDKTIIEAVWGLGEYAVQGIVTPDHYKVLKKENRIIEMDVNPQRYQLIRQQDKNVKTKVPKEKQNIQKLNSSRIIDLAEIGEKIHQHYFFPQDIEWAADKNKLYILQTRPVTTTNMKQDSAKSDERINGELVLKGDPASPGIGNGKVKLIKKADNIDRVKKGDVLVTNMTAPDFVPAMKRAVAIVTNLGGLTSHAAIVSRELGIPCVVGTEKATKILKNGDDVVVNGKTGEIWLGTISEKLKVKSEKPKRKKTRKIKTATNLYVNLAEPTLAKEMAKRDVDGIGLLRAEFMIAEIGTHPQRMLQQNKGKEFTNELAEGIKEFCQAFNPRPVVYRATDFKSNEYRHLKGGKDFEPEEPNPLLGFRGALRYISTPEVFELELEAIKQVRNKHGLKNLWMMVPFVRTPEELLEVKRIAAAQGLSRSPSFKLWMMVEIPSNVILLKDFIKVGIDGVSIGSNDLTMLTLGLDRDNNEIAYQFDETNPAVMKSIEKTIKTCKKNKVTSSICGQAPSQYPDVVEDLVKWGITSISVNPDAIERSREIIASAEKKKVKK
jgi:pyruvate,water dikinase